MVEIISGSTPHAIVYESGQTESVNLRQHSRAADAGNLKSIKKIQVKLEKRIRAKLCTPVVKSTTDSQMGTF